MTHSMSVQSKWFRANETIIFYEILISFFLNVFLVMKLLFDVDYGDVVSNYFLDLPKAFDCIDHQLLEGIKDVPLAFIKDYQQFVTVEYI